MDAVEKWLIDQATEDFGDTNMPRTQFDICRALASKWHEVGDAVLEGPMEDMTEDRDYWREIANDAVTQHLKERGEQDRQVLIAQVNDVTRQRDELQSINEGHVEDKAAYRAAVMELQREVAALQEEVAAVRKAGRSAMDERDQARESYRVTLDKLMTERNAWAATEPITNEPYLGLATTEQMFRELIVRFQMNTYGEHTWMLDFERALVLAEMLGGLSAPEKEYRTVDHE